MEPLRSPNSECRAFQAILRNLNTSKKEKELSFEVVVLGSISKLTYAFGESATSGMVSRAFRRDYLPSRTPKSKLI